MISSKEQRKISSWARVLAWVIVICVAVVFIDWIIQLVSGRSGGWTLGFGVTALGALVLLIIGPLSLSIAVRGRPPGWWSSIEDSLDVDKALRRYLEKRNR